MWSAIGSARRSLRSSSSSLTVAPSSSCSISCRWSCMDLLHTVICENSSCNCEWRLVYPACRQLYSSCKYWYKALADRSSSMSCISVSSIPFASSISTLSNPFNDQWSGNICPWRCWSFKSLHYSLRVACSCIGSGSSRFRWNDPTLTWQMRSFRHGHCCSICWTRTSQWSWRRLRHSSFRCSEGKLFTALSSGTRHCRSNVDNLLFRSRLSS